MHGVKYIKVSAELHFDDEIVVNIATPLLKKDIRRGDYFSDEEVQALIDVGGHNLSKLVAMKTLAGLYKIAKGGSEPPKDQRPPRWNDPFSMN
jgi:hypothetical protein